MEELITLCQKFDLVVSYLAFHYVEDYENLLKDIYNLLEVDGELIFSQKYTLKYKSL